MDRGSIPGGRRGRGDPGGEIEDPGVSSLAPSCSPELGLAAAVVGRRSFSRSGTKSNAGACQKDARDQSREVWRDRRARGRVSLPDAGSFAGVKSTEFELDLGHVEAGLARVRARRNGGGVGIYIGAGKR